MTMSKKILFSFITSKKLWLLELDLSLQEIPFVNEEAKETNYIQTFVCCGDKMYLSKLNRANGFNVSELGIYAIPPF